jgi:DNA-binding IclR family transcriptional regulator
VRADGPVGCGEEGGFVASGAGESSQTLDRGLTVLELLASRPDGMTAVELAEQLRTARAVVYRLLRTLEVHGLAAQSGARYFLGYAVADLARQLRPRLQSVALPLLRRLSVETESTALLTVADGDDALVLVTQEPPQSALHLAMREGSRHPLDRGADGVAILAGRPPQEGESKELVRARREGYAVTVGALQPGAVGVAAPILASDWCTASIGIVQLGAKVRDADIPQRVMAVAAEIAAQLTASASPTRG